MNYKGIIIEESLENPHILGEVKILKTDLEKVTEKHKTPWVEYWNKSLVEIPEDKAQAIAEKVSQSLDIKHAWYADFKNEKFHYIIFRNKIFKIDRSNPEEYKNAVEYGLSLGIPDYQLDFSPDIKEWQRD